MVLALHMESEEVAESPGTANSCQMKTYPQVVQVWLEGYVEDIKPLIHQPEGPINSQTI